jgi:hypothetical protein
MKISYPALALCVAVSGCAATGDGFTIYIDDIALGKQRLGPAAGAAR